MKPVPVDKFREQISSYLEGREPADLFDMSNEQTFPL